MGKRLLPDLNGRLPLSPQGQRVYDRLVKPMGKDWCDLVWIQQEFYSRPQALNRMSWSTVQQYIRLIRDRGWLEQDWFVSEKTNRKRMHFRIPEDLQQLEFYCAGCDTFFPGEDRYLCDDCMMVD